MWRIPQDTAQDAKPNGHQELQSVTVETPLDELFNHWNEDGAVIIRGLIAPEKIDKLHQELEPVLEKVDRGSIVDHEGLQAFHGRKTKRAGDIINHSEVFRQQMIENDFLHALCKKVFSEGGHAANYWLSTATTLNAYGPQPAQFLHRDLSLHPPYVLLGPNSTESVINFLVATCDFTEENGATVVIPGSNKWSYDQRGRPDQAIPADLKKGDCLFISGKVLHGMGEQKIAVERTGIQMSACASFLTPADAVPLVVKLETAKKLSRRAQRFLGFRSHYPRASSGLWTKDYSELALHLGLDDLDGVREDHTVMMQDHPESAADYLPEELKKLVARPESALAPQPA